VESVLAITAATWAIAMAFGSVLQIRRIVEHRSSRGNSVGISSFCVSASRCGSLMASLPQTSR
jgi:hypothetical protein